MNSLEIHGLNKSFGDFALKDVSFVLPEGSIMGFIGENGAGKSTTIKLILEALRKDSGEIRILGKSLSDSRNEILEQVGVVLDECCFPEAQNASQINASLRHIYKTWNSNRFFELIKQFGLSEKKAVRTYSKGMKMKLSLAAALSHDTKLLILDEATSGLDPVARDEMLDIFRSFIQDETHSIFVSSHITTDLEKICDSIAFIHKGELLLCEDKDELLEKYRMVKCSDKALKSIDPKYIAGIRKSPVQTEALVERAGIPQGMLSDPASLDNIMLFIIRGNEK